MTMTKGTVAILGTRYPHLLIEEEILSGFTLVTGVGGSPDEVIEATRNADVVIAGSRPQFTADVLERMHPRAIIRSGIGVDSVDLDRARSLGFWVVNIPDYGTDAVALHTLTLVLAALRRVTESDRLVKRGEWGFADLRPMRLPESLTAGVVGYGRIGRRVADHLRTVGFGSIIVHDPYVTDTESVSLADLLANADVVTLHAPGPADGSPLLGDEQIDLMKPNSILVNTARGSLIDPSALAKGLAAGSPMVAGLDVFAPEPPDLSPFVGVQDQLILTPHTAWYTEETQADLRAKSAWEARRILQGEEPLNAIVRPEEPS